MEKVYVIVIDEVDDCCNYPHKPEVFSKLEDAKERLDDIYNSACYEFDDSYKTERTETSVEIYKDGEYCTDHWSATIHEVEVR